LVLGHRCPFLLGHIGQLFSKTSNPQKNGDESKEGTREEQNYWTLGRLFVGNGKRKCCLEYARNVPLPNRQPFAPPTNLLTDRATTSFHGTRVAWRVGSSHSVRGHHSTEGVPDFDSSLEHQRPSSGISPPTAPDSSLLYEEGALYPSRKLCISALPAGLLGEYADRVQE
jgi:hypothetical protein